jgi:hypothetical protein
MAPCNVVLTDVSEERIASIFTVEGKMRKSASEETLRTGTSRLVLENKLSYVRAGKNGGGTNVFCTCMPLRNMFQSFELISSP